MFGTKLLSYSQELFHVQFYGLYLLKEDKIQTVKCYLSLLLLELSAQFWSGNVNFPNTRLKLFIAAGKKKKIKLMESIIIMKIQLSHAFPTVCSEKALCCLKQPAHNSICTFSHGVLMALIDPTDNINNKKRLDYR